jgi:hypothetical protein
MKVRIVKQGDKYIVQYKEGFFSSWCFVHFLAPGKYKFHDNVSVEHWFDSPEIPEKVMEDFIVFLKNRSSKLEIVKVVELQKSK